MRLPLPLTLAACLALTGCLNRSSTWETVISTRVDTRDTGDPSAAYAEHMSGVLKSANVEHKIVTYEFRYRTRLREDAMDTRTAVVYRDQAAGGRHPWWLVDNVSRKPVWLPGEDLERQIEFYLHRPATVVTVNGIPGGGEGKSALGEGKRMMAHVRPERSRPGKPFIERLFAVRKTERSRKFAAAKQPTESRDVAKRPEAIAAARFGRTGKTRVSLVKTAPVKAAAITRKDLALFRVRHGTTFDPSSVTDRVKMERLTSRGGRNVARL